MNNWASRIVGYEDIAPDQLLANPLNARRHPASQRDALRAGLDAVGWIAPVIVNRTTGNMIDGHARVEEALSRNLATVPACYVELTPDEEAVALATLDRVGELAVYDEEALRLLLEALPDDLDTQITKLIESIPTVNFDDTPIGTGDSELDDPPDPDEVPDSAPPHTKPGDVWQLGPHRLICGDCRDLDVVTDLLEGARINVAITSPPYADRRQYDEGSGFRPIPPDEYVAWFEKVASSVASHLADDGSWFVNIKAGSNGLSQETYVMDLVLAHARQWGWLWATEFCWERSGVPLGPTRRFKNQFEPIYQFVRGEWKFRPEAVQHESSSVPQALGVGAGDTSWARHQGAGSTRSNSDAQGDPNHAWFKDRTAPGLAYPGNRLPTFSGSHEATGHTAAFPVGLPEFFIKAYTDPGDTVHDPFTGSGSTILAAHRTDRIGYGTELSPGYCDIICKRFQRHTGIIPTRNSEPVDFLT